MVRFQSYKSITLLSISRSPQLPKKYEVRRDDRLWMYTIFVPKNSLAGFGHQSPSGRSLLFFLSSKCPSPKSSPRWAALKVTKRLGKTSSCGAMWEDIVCCFLQLPGLAEFEFDFYAGSRKGTDRLRGIPMALRSTEPYWSCRGKTWSFQSKALTRLLETVQSISLDPDEAVRLPPGQPDGSTHRQNG